MGNTEKMGYIEKFKRLSTIQKISFWSLLAIIFYTLAGFLAAPPLLKFILEKKIPEVLHRTASIQKLKLNPYTLTATVEGFALQKKENSTTFISFDHLFINLQLSSIVKRALVIKNFQLSGPNVNCARLTETEYSFSDLFTDTANDAESSAEQGNSGKPFLFSINNIEIANGAIEFQDRPKDKTHLVSALNLAIPTISNLPNLIDTHVQPAFSANINGTDFSLTGKTKPFKHSRETIFDIKLTKLDIPGYLAYIPNPTEATIKSGSLDVDAQLSYIDTQGNQSLSLSGLLSLEDLNLVDFQNASYARFPKIAVQVAASNLLKQNIVLESINVIKPDLDFIRQVDDKILPLSLLTSKEQAPPADNEENGEESKPVALAIHTVTITDGKISFLDQKVSDFKTTLTPLDFTLTNFSTQEQSMADYLVQIKSESDELLSLQGQVGINPLVVDGNIDLNGLNLVKYNPYSIDILNPEITEGKINFSSHFHVEKDEQEMQTSLDNMALQLTDFALSGDGPKALINIPNLAISDTTIDVNKQVFTIGQLNSQSAEFLVKKGNEGEINLANIIKESKQKESSSMEEETETEEIEKKDPWVVTLKNGNVEKYTVTFVDNGPETPFTAQASDMSLKLTDISTAQDSIGEISFACKLNENGKITAHGTLGIAPLATALTVEGSTIDLPPLQNYAEDHVQMLITDGAVSTSGELNITQKETISAHFKGNAQVANLALTDNAGEDLLKWKDLSVSGIQFSNQPSTLDITKVDWKDLFLQLTIQKDGSLTLANALHPPTSTEEATPEEEPPSPEAGENSEQMKINISTFTLADSTFDFKDQSISPSYAATLDNFGGTITGLSTEKESLAQVELKGSINQHAPMTVTGTINPLKDELFADLKLDFHDIDLSPTSPYTGKFIGYKTDKGKLTLDLHYILNGKELTAKNQAFLDQFTLGDIVDSPDAVSLPIHLAIALLKNRSGEIFLDIPVNGNLDDPEFSVASVVFRVLFNLIAKAATSPFALLGALIPDGEDLQYVSFKPGFAEIEQNAADKLTKMASVLFERPGLRMDIQGSSSPDKDRQTLALLRLKQLISLQKVKEENKAKTIEKIQDDLLVTEEEYPRYLALAYEESRTQDTAQGTAPVKPNKPDPKKSKKDETANEVPETIEFMEAELLKKITITDEDLRLLAIQRATNVLDFLAEKGPIEPERLFLIEPQMPSGQEANESKPAAQVDLIIK